MPEPKRMDIKEFKDEGFLQEANRLFFHPLGLALAVEEDDDGVWSLCCVYDAREDPEGFCFGEAAWKGEEDWVKMNNVAQERIRHIEERTRLFGSSIQNIGQGFPD